MTVEDKNFNIKNGLSVGSGKHQILDSNGRISANYFTLHAGGRYLSAGVDLYDLIATTGIPPVSTDSWNYIHDVVSLSSDQWDAAFSFVNADSATNNTIYNRTNYINITGGVVEQDFGVKGETYLEGSLRVDGHTYLSAAMYVENDAYVMGDFRADGDVWLATESVYPKTVYVGATDDDNIVFVADVSSNFVPNHDTIFDLGTSEQQWRELFVQDISASNDVFIDNDLLVSANGTVGADFRVSGHTTVGGNTVLSGTLDVDDATYIYDTLDVELDTQLHSNLFVTENTTISGNTTLSGTLDVDDATYIYDTLDVELKTTLHDDLLVSGDTHILGDLRVDGNAYLSAGVDGIINVGDTNTDNVVFHADVDSGIIPNKDVTYDLGTSTQQWRELFVQDVSASNDIFVDNDLLVSSNGTVGEDFRVSGAVVVGGYTELSGTLDVKDITTLHDDLSVKGDIYVDGNVYLSAGESGEIHLGTDNTDNVIFNADVNSDIIPEQGRTFNIGTDDKHWNTLYVHDVSASGDIRIYNTLYTDTIRTDDRDVLHIAAGSDDTAGSFLRLHEDNRMFLHADHFNFGDLYETGDNFRPFVLHIHTDEQHISMNSTLKVANSALFESDVWIKGDLRVDGNAYLSAGVNGVINVGDTSTDNVVFYADIDSNIIPDDDITFDLGTSTQQWRELFVQDISASNDVFIDNDLLVSANGTVGADFRVSGHTTVGGNTVLSGTLDVDDATNIYDTLDVELDTRLHSNLYTTGDTTISGNTTLSGTLDVDDATHVYDTLDVDLKTTLHSDLLVSGDTHIVGDLRVDGNAYLSAGVDGIINVGDTNTDNVVFHADIDSGLTPNKDVTYDLGTNTQQWRELFVQDISASNDIFVDNDLLVSADGTIGRDFRVSGHATVSGNTTLSGTLDVDDATYVYDTLDVELDTHLHDDLYVTNNTTISGNTVLSGTLDVKDFVTLYDDLSVRGDIYVDGNAYLSAGIDGNIYVGDADTDNVIFRADVDSNIIPDDDITFDLGTSTQQWRELFVQDISASNDVFVDNDLLVSANGTIGTNFCVSGNTTVGGNTVLSGTLDVDDATNIYDTLDVELDTRLHSNLYTTGDTTISGNTVLSGALDVDDATYVYDTLDVELDTHLHSNLFVTGNTTISGNTVLSGALDVDDATYVYDTLDVELDTRLHSNLFVADNTTVSGNTTLSGTLDVDDATYVYDTLDVDLKTTLHSDLLVSGDTHIVGDLRVDGNAYLSAGVGGNIYVGDTNTDNVVFHADIDSGITPNKDVTYDLGTNTQQWRELFVQDISASNDIFVDNDLHVSANTTIGADLIVSGHTTVSGNTVLSGTLDVKDLTTLHDDLSVKGDLYVDGNAYLSAGVGGNIYVGDTNTDNVVFNADIDSGIKPDDDVTFDLGASTQQWRELFVKDISASNDVFVDNDLTIQGHTSANGGMSLTGDLTATDDVFIKGSIVVEGHAYFGFGSDSSQINIGDPNVDEIIFNADVGSDILPYPSNTYNLGSASRRWLTVYTNDLHTKNNVLSEGNITTHGHVKQIDQYDTQKSVSTTQKIWRSESGSNTDQVISVNTFRISECNSVRYEILVINAEGSTTLNADYLHNTNEISGTQYGRVSIGTDPVNDVDCTLINDRLMVSLNVKSHSKIMITGTSMLLI